MSQFNALRGPLTMLGSGLLICCLAYVTGGFTIMFEGMGLLLTGNVTALRQTDHTFGMMIAVILAVVPVALVTALACSGIVNLVIGPRVGRHENVESLQEMTKKNHFLVNIIEVAIEELIGRWFFLGFLTMWAPLSGPVMFYVLFLTGNSVWALIHLANFHDSSDRHPLRTLAQFTAGVFYTYLFVAYGLTACILGHFAFNSLLYSLHHRQRFNSIDVVIIGYSVLCVMVSYWFMDKPLSDVQQWFTSTIIEGLPGWRLQDYVLLMVFASSAFNAILSVLLYDRGNAGFKFSFEAIFLAAPVIVGMIFAAYWLAGYLVDNELYRALIAAVLVALIGETASGSAMARNFWRSLSTGYLSICTALSLGFVPSLLWMLALVIVSIPLMFLAQFDD